MTVKEVETILTKKEVEIIRIKCKYTKVRKVFGIKDKRVMLWNKHGECFARLPEMDINF